MLGNHPKRSGLITPSSEPTLILIRYLAQRLGVNVRTIWRLAAADKAFPKPVKIGHSTRFVQSEVEEYIQELLAHR